MTSAQSGQTGPASLLTALVRRAGKAFSAFGASWRAHKALRMFGYAAGSAFALIIGFVFLVTRGLPSASALLEYQPPLPAMVRDINGDIVYSYARERRVQLRFADFPKPLINAFLAAEDKSFWSHEGVDITGLAGAVVDYTTKFGTGRRARGGSTITQQVAKNILLSNEYSITRKFKEIILARRIESILSKEKILELYLNEIPLGRRSFGVQAAARAYFGKDVGDLSLHETAFLAILPKAPERYGRPQYKDMAIDRRNYVLDQMVANGWISVSEANEAKSQPLGLVQQRVEKYDPAHGYYMEEVRRRLIAQFGENADDGPDSVYSGGLWVRTSLDPELQKATRDSLRAGLMRYSAGRISQEPIEHIANFNQNRWQTDLILANKSVDYKDWRVGVVISRNGNRGMIGFTDGTSFALGSIPEKIRAGDIVAAAPLNRSSYVYRSVPQVSGAMLVEEPQSGRIVAMQGGFDAGLSSFNRAIQAERQPGSTIKPFVYAAALDAGMTPASMVQDTTFCVYQGAALGEKCFRNFGGSQGSGAHTMRWGLEQSRNLMTVRLANDVGMDRVTKTISRVGIGDYKKYLSFALGAGSTTVEKMVNAFATLANNGVQYDASVVDYVQNRNGKVIWRADARDCSGCNMPKWDGKAMPRLQPRGKQVMDPRTAFQVVHMLEGVVQRGTAVVLSDLGLTLFGKTGTTTGPTNVWFIGGSQQYVAGVYLGYDMPRSLGGYAQGGRIAAPIFKQFVQETRGRWIDAPFIAPDGIRMVRINRATGQQVFGAEPTGEARAAVIWEAFKPEAAPPRPPVLDQITRQRRELASLLAESRARREALNNSREDRHLSDDFVASQGGIY